MFLSLALLGLAASPAFADLGVGSTPETAFLVMPVSSASTVGLPGEVLASSSSVVEGSGAPPSLCDPAGTSTVNFEVSGTATGPYPGTFTESGTVTLGPQTLPAPVAGTGLAGAVLTFTARYQIDSAAATITGTKTLTALVAGDEATNAAACASFVNSTDFANGSVVSASGRIYSASVKSTYDAAIAFTDGTTTTESGTASTVFGEVELTSVTCQNGGKGCVYASAPGLTEKFLASTPPPPGNADLALTKTGPVTAHAGEELTYLIRVKNNGPDVATGVQVVDTLPAGLDFVSVVPDAPVCTGTITIVCGLGTLLVGEVKAVTIVARGRVPGPVHNDAYASANEHDPNPFDNTAGWSTDVGPAAANVTISKAARILTGPRLQYTIDVENLGPSVATGVVAKDMLDPMWALIDVTTTQGSCTGRVICAIGTLALGQKETVTITVGLTSPGPVHNEATVGWDGGGIASASVDSPPFPDLRISKSHVGDFKAGQTGSYLLSVSNVGTGPTTSAIVVADTLPAGMTFDSGVGGGFTCLAADQLVTCTRSEPLGAGDSASFTLSVLVATDAPPLVTNVARVAGGGGVYQLDGASDPGGVLPPPVIGLTKRVKEQTVRVGHNLTYLIDVTNTGGQDATNVRVIDTLPASVDLVSVNPGSPTCTGTTTITCSLGDLPVGQTVTVEIIVRPRLVTLLTNQATATADGIVVPATGSVSTEILPPPDLGITKEASAPVVVQDSVLRYTITAKNLGPGDATNVKINDPLPPGVTLVSVQPDSTYAMTCNVTAPPEISNLSGPVVCTIPVLPELTTSKVVLTVRVVRFGSLLNTATVSSDDPDPGSGNDAATATVLVNRPPTADPFGPYTVPEGGSVHLSGAGSDPDSDAITFAWDLDGDAIFETASQNPVFSAATIDGPSARTVSLKVCDTKGACTIKATTVTITNVAPQITSVTNSGPVMIGTPVQVAVVATDVAGPTRDPLRYEFDCDNNGTYEIGPQANASAACTFTASGIRTVRVRVNDGDGGIAIGSTDVLAYAYPGTGQFVIGNLTNHAVGNRVNFWGAQWAKNNPLSGGAPPTAFKGFDSRSTIPTCGSSWTSNPGNSSVPPQSVPQYLAVIVSSKVATSGSLISGDIKQVVIVKTDPGYSSDPGHPGTGTVTAVLCTVR